MRMRFLGTGGAEGIPAIGCECVICARARREGGRLTRLRPSVLFSLPDYELLVDTPPDIREQLDVNGVRKIDGIFLTHEHTDHTGGLKEFLFWRESVDLFAEPRLYRRLTREYWGQRLPDATIHLTVRPGMSVPFSDFFFIPFEVRHTVPCLGFVLYEGRRRIAHLADSGSRLSNFARCLIDGADVLIVNTPTFEPPKEDHITVIEAIELKKQAGVGQLILTHISHGNRPHDDLEDYVSQIEGVTVAYDGLTVDV